MRLIPQVLAEKEVFVPPQVWIDEHLQDETKAWPLIRESGSDRERSTFLKPLIRVCPIPAFLVLDGFAQDIDVRIIIRRLSSLTGQRDPWFLHAYDFLLACTLQPKAQTAGTAMPSDVFLERPTPALREWGATRAFQLCPTLRTNAPPLQAQPPAAPAGPSMAELFQQFLDMQRAATTTPAAGPAEEKKDDSAATTLGMAPSELKRLLTMCGLDEGQEEFLPHLYTDLAEPNLSKEGKNLLIREVCRRNVKYDDAEIPLLAPLLKTIRTKEWSGDSGVTTLVSAVKGLSPFLLIDITEEDEAAWNEQYEMLEKATACSLDDIKTTTKLEAKVPSSFAALHKCLKTFANLLFALFGALCPLLIQLQDIIRAMGKFSTQARAAMLHKNRAAIMWVLFLQCREFTAGKMVRLEHDTHLHAFTQLRFDLLAGKDVTHNGVPFGLVEAPGQQPKRQLEKEDPPNEPPVKKIRTCQTHPKLKAAFDPIFASNPNVSLKAMCEASNVKLSQLFPHDNRRCVLAALKGSCSYKNCRNKHGYRVTEDEATQILQLLDPVIKDPSKMTKVSP